MSDCEGGGGERLGQCFMVLWRTLRQWSLITVSKNWILKKGGERKRESKRKRRLAAEDTNITVTKKERMW